MATRLITHLNSCPLCAHACPRCARSELYRDLGDLGDAAQQLKQRQAVLQRPPPLTLAGVFAALQQLAREEGAGGEGMEWRDASGPV